MEDGEICIYGPTVMKGYYKRPELTDKVLSADGWLDTGDLVIQGVHGEIKILGRVKDTIVLSGGENVEPLPIEAKLQESRFIATSVVVGQDQRYLGALIVPNQDELLYIIKQDYLTKLKLKPQIFWDYNITKPERKIVYEYVSNKYNVNINDLYNQAHVERYNNKYFIVDYKKK